MKSSMSGGNSDLNVCPKCQSTVVVRAKRSRLAKLFSSHKQFMCRACYTRFREDGRIVEEGFANNPVLNPSSHAH